MCEHELHLVALRRELKRHLRCGAEGVGEDVRRFVAQDFRLHDHAAFLTGFMAGGWGLIRRQAGMVKLQLHFTAGFLLHRATRKPPGALLGVGKKVPDALNGSGEEPHHADFCWGGELGGLFVGLHEEGGCYSS